MNQRVDWIDYAKGIGIILVVYGHVARGLFAAGMEMNEQQYLLVDSIIYSFHMPLYFAIAGWFFYSSVKRNGALNMVGSRINTVLYVFVLWSLLHGLVEVGLSKFTTNQLTLGELLDITNHPRNHLWFLFALFFVSILSAFIYAFLNIRWHLAVLAFGVVLYWLRHSINPSVTAIDFYIIGFSVFLMLGVTLSYYFSEYLSDTTPLMALSLLSFVGAQYLFHWEMQWTWLEGPILARLALAVWSIFAVLIVSRWLGRFDIPLLRLLGSHSLEIYLMHLIAGSGVRIVLQKFLGIDDVAIHLVAGTLFGIVLPLIGAWVIYKLRLGILFSPPSFLRVPKLVRPS